MGVKRFAPSALNALLLVMLSALLLVLPACARTETSQEPIAYETQEKPDPSLWEGESVVEQEGQEGEAEITWAVSGSGESERREQESSRVLVEPVPRVLRVGTKTVASSGLVYAVEKERSYDRAIDEFWVCRGDGTEQRKLMEIEDLETVNDLWQTSPGSPYLAIAYNAGYSNKNSLLLVNLKTNKQTKVEPTAMMRIKALQFSSDGRTLYYIREPWLGISGGKWSLRAHDVPSGKTRTLIKDLGYGGMLGQGSLLTSGDGSKVAVPGRRSITIVDADGGNLKTTELPGSPSFISRDGSLLYLDGGRSALDVAADNSLSNQRQVELGVDSTLRIEAGGLIAASANKTYSVGSTSLDMVADLSGRSSMDSAFHPSGRAIAFLGSQDGNPEVYVRDANGQETRITNDLENERYPMWCGADIGGE